jgi:hypothetical protein
MVICAIIDGSILISVIGWTLKRRYDAWRLKQYAKVENGSDEERGVEEIVDIASASGAEKKGSVVGDSPPSIYAASLTAPLRTSVMGSADLPGFPGSQNLNTGSGGVAGGLASGTGSIDLQRSPSSQSHRRRASILPTAVLGITDASHIKAAVGIEEDIGEDDEEEEQSKGEEQRDDKRASLLQNAAFKKSAIRISEEQQVEIVVAGKTMKVSEIEKVTGALGGSAVVSGNGHSSLDVYATTTAPSTSGQGGGEHKNAGGLSLYARNANNMLSDSQSDLASIMKAFSKALNPNSNNSSLQNASPPSLKIDFRFEDLGLSLPDGRTVLQGVTGKILSNKLTAIMGPSGAGSKYSL